MNCLLVFFKSVNECLKTYFFNIYMIFHMILVVACTHLCVYSVFFLNALKPSSFFNYSSKKDIKREKTSVLLSETSFSLIYLRRSKNVAKLVL